MLGAPAKCSPCPLPSPARASTETKDVPEGRAAENASHRDVLTAIETRGSGLILQGARRSVSEALLAGCLCWKRSSLPLQPQVTRTSGHGCVAVRLCS